MPVNCAAAPATPAPVPPSTSTQEGVERQIGDVLLAIVDLSGRALEEVHDGGRMRGDTKRQGGDLVAKLYEWQQSMPEPDFITLLRRQGRLRLRHRNGVALSEAAVDEIIVLLLGVVGRVSATMRASAARRQHAA
jgi:hypothetical protein